ncbi:MAG: hypothetical protein P4L87_11320 [Formivibrio sp.]|nr:hypothetical protein [Formivibrio sp.]
MIIVVNNKTGGPWVARFVLTKFNDTQQVIILALARKPENSSALATALGHGP